MLSSSTDFQNNIYANGRQIDSRITYTLNGMSTVYDDTYITQMSVLEEMSTLNDTLPSNELQVTLDNTKGTFNFMNLSNMYQIIAQRPKIVAEMGLVLANFPADNIVVNFLNKTYGAANNRVNMKAIPANGNIAALLNPTDSNWVDAGQSGFDAVKALDNNVSIAQTNVNNGIAQQLFAFDIIGILTDKYGSQIWQGKTDLADKIAIAANYIASITPSWYGFGSAASGNFASLKLWDNNSSWDEIWHHSSPTIANINGTLTNLPVRISSDGYIYLLVCANAASSTITSQINTDYVELQITMNAIFYEEWQPMGTFYLDAWKSDVGAVTVTLIGHDLFTMLDNITYGGEGVGANKTLYDIAVDVFQTAGITDYYIDSSLKNYTTTTGFKESITCRVALQHIGIAGMAAVYQDRNGTIQIKPFLSIDTGGNYITYAGSGLYAGFDPFDTAAYAKINDGNGMKRLDLNNMYTVPEITLDRSIYQLIIKVYSSTSTSSDYVVTNSAINGQNGQSFTIDNPLINTTAQAQAVANWFMYESNFNVVYKSNWRGNPILECADIVTVSNGIDATFAKQARIYKQEYQYQGYLTCQTESRGGV